MCEKEVFMYPVFRNVLEEAPPEEKARVLKAYNRVCKLVGYDGLVPSFYSKDLTNMPPNNGLAMMILGLIMPLLGLLLTTIDIDNMTDEELRTYIDETIAKAEKNRKDNVPKDADLSSEEEISSEEEDY